MTFRGLTTLLMRPGATPSSSLTPHCFTPLPLVHITPSLFVSLAVCLSVSHARSPSLSHVTSPSLVPLYPSLSPHQTSFPRKRKNSHSLNTTLKANTESEKKNENRKWDRNSAATIRDLLFGSGDLHSRAPVRRGKDHVCKYISIRIY